MAAPTNSAPKADDKAADTTDQAPNTKTFTVAPRRELTHDGDGKRPAKNFVAGDEIELPVEEGERLQDLGYLLKDDGSAAVPTGGPATVTGVEIKEVG